MVMSQLTHLVAKILNTKRFVVAILAVGSCAQGESGEARYAAVCVCMRVWVHACVHT